MKRNNKRQPAQKPKGVRGVVVRACNILPITILMLVVVVAAGLLVAQVLGFKPMAVLSGSMEPAYATGSVVFVDTNVSAESIETGDVITYSLASRNTVVTHRVIEIDDKESLFTTKGDANESIDGPVPFGNFIGRTVGFYIPYVGTLLLLAGTTQGSAVALFALAFIAILLIVPFILTPSKSPEKAGEREPVADGLSSDGVREAHFRVDERGAL